MNPTPVVIGDKLLVCGENAGSRLYRFGPDGRIDPRAVAVNEDLAPDCHTPVVVGPRIFGVWNDLFCLDLRKGLKTVGRAEGNSFATYASEIASEDRLLVVGLDGHVEEAERVGVGHGGA